MIRTMLLFLLLLLCLAPCASASELEPVLIVTGVVDKSGLAEAQAEVARQRKEAAAQLEQALREDDKSAQAAAAQQLAQATAREESLAQAVAHAVQQVNTFGALLASAIKKELGCARVIQEHELSAFLDRQREMALAKAGTDADPLDGDSMQEPEGEYEVKVTGKIPLSGGQAGPVAMVATCIHKKTSAVLASVASSGGGGESPTGLADTFAGQLARFEVCPYLGTVSVTSDLTKTPRSKAEHPVSCNRRDGLYYREDKEHSVTNQRWELEKTGRRAASGDVSYTGVEQYDELEEDDCYQCSSGGKGRRTYTKNITKNFTIAGLSEESADKKGETVNKDSRIRIRFLDSGVYMIKIDAVSKNGSELVDLNEKATGSCDAMDRDPPPEKKARDTHLSGEWGPFRGSPLDKRLADTQEESLNNPNIGETGKRTLRFELSRK